LVLFLVNSEVLAYVERCLEFLIDLEAQLPTRRYFNKLLEDHQILTLCKFAPIMKRDAKKLVSYI
jgi:intron-binding protein aquarius